MFSKYARAVAALTDYCKHYGFDDDDSIVIGEWLDELENGVPSCIGGQRYFTPELDGLSKRVVKGSIMLTHEVRLDGLVASSVEQIVTKMLEHHIVVDELIERSCGNVDSHVLVRLKWDRACFNMKKRRFSSYYEIQYMGALTVEIYFNKDVTFVNPVGVYESIEMDDSWFFDKQPLSHVVLKVVE
ncbi:hypothetical protein AB4254_09355 [Vibrio breoganii]